MDKDWLLSLNQKSIVVVPTNSLVNHLTEQYATCQLELAKSVWLSPNIAVWSTFVKTLWLHNRPAASTSQLLSAAQSDLLWTKIIEQSARQDQSLVLLNVPQTVRAVRASWQKLHDWCIDESRLADEFAVDHQQLLLWFEEYRQVLASRKLVDPAQIPKLLLDSGFDTDFKHFYWFSYDLITQAQQSLSEAFELRDVSVNYIRPQAKANCISRQIFNDEHSEISSVFYCARQRLEANPSEKIAIIIPDLQHRYRQVEDIARDVFYPNWSPLELSENGSAYRFSLGRRLIDLAPLSTLLGLIDLLKGAVKVSDFALMLRSVYIGDAMADSNIEKKISANAKQVILTILAESRLHRLSLSKLVALYEQSTHKAPEVSDFLQRVLKAQSDLRQQLAEAKNTHGFASLSFSNWLVIFDDWLALWGWSAAVSELQPSSHEYQLQQRWNSVKQELIGLSLLQKTLGFSRMIDLLKTLLRETVFLPKASSTAIIISGTLEAIGREVDCMFVTGMHQDFPKPGSLDAFIPKQILAEHQHPHASVDRDFEYQKGVIQNLVACANEYSLSYAKVSAAEADIERSASSLFDQYEWQLSEFEKESRPKTKMQRYEDVKGPVLEQYENLKGGAKIFENQSNCAFRAFAAHRLGLRSEQETEFGLDALDRGNIIHYLLETLWGELKSQENLARQSEAQLTTIIKRHIDQAVSTNPHNLSDEKQNLLLHERDRLISLLNEWMGLELMRPRAFKVIERELKGQSELGGVPFRYIIDRVDELADGRRVVIDYKTGEASRSDWMGDRIKSPQLPLYALSVAAPQDIQAIAGISFAKVKRWKPSYEELAQDDIFHASDGHTRKRAEVWQQESKSWQSRFEVLAQSFVSGDAVVNPSDANTCAYCEFDALCRVDQLRAEHLDDE